MFARLPAPVPAAQVSPIPLSPLANLHVLLVEDDPEVREATLALLEEEGARVTTLDAAEPALEILRGSMVGFDLLFSDVMLGGPLTGFDLAAESVARHPDVPVLLATGYAGSAGLPASLPARVPVLMKPYRRADLLGAVTAARRMHRGSRS
jgi:CheY-like chemotaxis protein